MARRCLSIHSRHIFEVAFLHCQTVSRTCVFLVKCARPRDPTPVAGVIGVRVFYLSRDADLYGSYIRNFEMQTQIKKVDLGRYDRLTIPSQVVKMFPTLYGVSGTPLIIVSLGRYDPETGLSDGLVVVPVELIFRDITKFTKNIRHHRELSIIERIIKEHQQ